MSLMEKKEYKSPIIFFDGICGLCNGFVDFLLKVDTKNKFFFATLQGDTAKSLLPSEMIDNMDSVVLYVNGKTLKKSEAVLEIFRILGGFWKIVTVGKYLPEFLRDKAYDLTADNRYSIFGKKDVCRIPTPDERSKFLD